VTSISTVFALVSRSIEQEFAAKRAQYKLIELLLNKLVAVHLMDFALAFPDGALTTETARRVERTLPDVFFY